MKRSILFAMVTLAASAWLAQGANAADPRQITVASGATRGFAPPAHHVVFGHSNWDVPPGGVGAVTTTPYTTRFYTVTAGELTATVGDKTQAYTAGQSFMVPAGIQSQTRNNKDTIARFMLTSVVPAGMNTVPGGVISVPGTASATNPPIMTSGITGGLKAAALPGTIDVLQTIVEYEPGFRTPNHIMNHPHVFTILAGEVTFGYLDGTVERYKAGETAVMTPGRPGYMSNETGAMATWQITWLVTPGTPTTSPVAATSAPAPPTIAPPRAGDAGLAEEGATVPAVLRTLLLALAASAPLLFLRGARTRR
jgi:quercetin dioxygenase-like cupin family protein